MFTRQYLILAILITIQFSFAGTDSDVGIVENIQVHASSNPD